MSITTLVQRTHVRHLLGMGTNNTNNTHKLSEIVEGTKVILGTYVQNHPGSMQQSIKIMPGVSMTTHECLARM